MAIMYPHQLDEDVPRSEQVVYEWLRDALPRDWRVIHGKRFIIRPVTAGERATEGELDFLVIHPQHGVLALEVKGGAEVGRDDRGWYSIPHGETSKVRIKDPGDQIQEGVHKLLAYVRRQTINPELTNLSYCWGVAFPDMALDGTEELGPELPRPLVLDRDGLKRPKQTLEEMYHYWQRRENRQQALSKEASDELIGLLLPRFRFTAVPGPVPIPTRKVQQTISAGETQFIRQTNEQNQILEAMSDNSRLSIKGAAGTGKTIIAFEQARRLAAHGRQVLFLCYNTQLAEDLQRKTDSFEVINFHKLCSQLIRRAGITFNPPSGKADDFWNETAAEELLFVLEEDPDLRWDAVIIDEGQDFKTLWWLAIEKLLRSSDSTLWIFHDPSQDLYGGDPIRGLDLHTVNLSLNCRNTKNIGKKSYGFSGLEPKFREDTLEGVAVKEISCGSDHEMAEVFRKELHRLINQEGFSNKDIVALVPKSERSSSLWRRKNFGNFKLVSYGEVQNQDEVGFSTIRRFKGLEAKVVILCEVTSSEDPALLYVGASRAKHVLIVIKSSN